MTIVLAGGIGFGVEKLGEQLVAIMPAKLVYMLTAGFVALVVVALFVVGLVAFRVVRQDELGSYPRLVQKALRPLMRLQGGAARGRARR